MELHTCAISPNHPISQNLANQDTEIDDFIKKCNETKMAEADMAKADKLGLKTNLKLNILLQELILMSGLPIMS